MVDNGELPAHARLSSGITEEGLLQAILQSGYPFQAAVANTLEESADSAGIRTVIQEEWAYTDSESGQTRSIDVFLEAYLSPRRASTTNRVAPMLNLLVECKQSDLPYIFFVRPNSPAMTYNFPELAGLPSQNIVFFPEQNGEIGERSFSMSLHDVFEVWEDPFLNPPVPYALSISKLARKGSKLELGGEEVYRSITLPLVKAADHLIERSEPSPSARYHRCRFVIPLAVLRAPMYSVFRVDGKDAVSAVPWVRACRLEPARESTRTSSDVRHFDIVHEHYLGEYFGQLVESLRALGTKITSHEDVVADGRGAVKMDEDAPWKSMHPLPPGFQPPPKDEHGITITRQRDKAIFGPAVQRRA